ncbi:transaldolase [Euzebya tangerina]|uniref:transaldolase n=1 Tax=Euzebya tangerina TaxID=591198 RepID=UPI000E31BB1B|nr:transaldolase [Euzebya tangerina]
MSTSRLAAIERQGQAIWLDSIKRSYLGEGNYLDQLISDGDIYGLTSNPSIFASAVAGSDEYDEQVASLAAEGKDAAAILWEVMKADITFACDQFADLYASSDGLHGYVSIEVDPSKAFDTDGTIEQGRALWNKIDRPNLMVKVPGTEPGLAAITALIGEGVNVNVTLLFSVDRYQQVMSAYMDGLAQARDAGRNLASIASVASFFVSRVDAKVDPMLPEDSDLRGRVAIANAQAAFTAFMEVCMSERWKELSASGAAVQRPLWASTSTKDPSYPDTLYVDELVGPNTVNTVPEATLDAVRDHGAEPTDRLSGTGPAAVRTLSALSDAGIDLDQVTKELETEGVEKFIASFEEAVATVDEAL